MSDLDREVQNELVKAMTEVSTPRAQWQAAIVENDGYRMTLAESQRIIEQQRAVIESLTAELDEARAELARLTTQRLWVWRNFSATKRELWVFDNPFPVYMDSDDPQTIGEPYGYALFKPSRKGRTDITDEQAMERMNKAFPTPKEPTP